MLQHSLPTQERPHRGGSIAICTRLQRVWTHNQLKKTNVIARDASQVPSVKINDYTLEVVEDFTYLGSNISNNLSLDTEIHRRIGMHYGQTDQKMLTEHPPLWQRIVDHIHVPGAPPQHLPHAVPQAYPRHHLARPYPLQRHNGPCQDPYSLLSQRRLRWLGHVRRMEDGRLPKDILYGQLTSGARPVGRPAH